MLSLKRCRSKTKFDPDAAFIGLILILCNRHMKIVLPAGTPFGRTKFTDTCYVKGGKDFDFIVLQGNRDDYDGLKACREVQCFNIRQRKWRSGSDRTFLHIEFHVTMDGSLRINIRPTEGGST
jgi:hypothetical protein